MSKVVLNRCYGGFNLSNEAVEKCVELGMKLTETDEAGHIIDKTAHFYVMKNSCWEAQKYGVVRDDEKFRTNPTLVQVVEEMGEKANGVLAELEVKECYYEHWHIHEFDGKERIKANYW